MWSAGLFFVYLSDGFVGRCMEKRGGGGTVKIHLFLPTHLFF